MATNATEIEQATERAQAQERTRAEAQERESGEAEAQRRLQEDQQRDQLGELEREEGARRTVLDDDHGRYSHGETPAGVWSPEQESALERQAAWAANQNERLERGAEVIELEPINLPEGTRPAMREGHELDGAPSLEASYQQEAARVEHLRGAVDAVESHVGAERAPGAEAGGEPLEATYQAEAQRVEQMREAVDAIESHASPRVEGARESVERYQEHEELREEIQAGNLTDQRAQEIAQRQQELGGDVYSSRTDAERMTGQLNPAERAEFAAEYPEQAEAAERLREHTQTQEHAHARTVGLDR